MNFIVWAVKTAFLFGLFHFAVMPVIERIGVRNQKTMFASALLFSLPSAALMVWMQYVPFLLILLLCGANYFSLSEMRTERWQARFDIVINRKWYAISTYSFIALSCMLAWILQSSIATRNPEGVGMTQLWRYLLNNSPGQQLNSSADDQAAERAYQHGDYATAFQEWKPLAELGNSVAQYMLGELYFSGRGVIQNYDEAVRWFRSAAHQEHSHAQFYLGLCYDRGLGVRKDYHEAERWFRRAAEQDHSDAQFHLAELYRLGQGLPQDMAKAVQWYERAARQLHIEALYNLGVAYDEGKGIAQDYAKAVHNYQIAAEHGFLPAQLNLANHYLTGKGVPEDFTEARRWLQGPADHGLGVAQSKLGLLYAGGMGGHRDLVQAYQWFRLAETDGVAEATELHQKLSTRLTAEQRAEAERHIRAWHPASSLNRPDSKAHTSSSALP
jgi:uncharacterized protein